ncbi:MAG: hypothetical protein A3K77_05645 [Euryarchaeota archaeon RBG_13_31_8]|nr:MAG: hypothetical protein A3K77_05645 [Euryarchaeota archaeon RBG_13_31_8]
MVRISLIDVDSKIPNLALMKLSAYHKAKGDIVGFNLSDPDQVYISCIFKKNKNQALGIAKMFSCPVMFGGSGINYDKLPDEIEHIMPDYDLYPSEYSMGFTSRGCIRKCSFCIVPDKEGMIKPNCDISDFYDPRFSHIVLLDNNILALPDHFKTIAKQIMDYNLTVDFNQGLDIRLVNDGNAKILSDLRVEPDYRFAWDNVKDEKQIRKGIKILQDHNIKHCLFYVLVGYNTSESEDLYRLNILKELDQRAYVMRYRTNRFYNDLSAWVNQQRFFMSMDFNRFVECRHNRGLLNDI